MALQQALGVSKTLAKHNPFVRMTQKEQSLANQASAVIKRNACTEDTKDLMDDSKWKALF